MSDSDKAGEKVWYLSTAHSINQQKFTTLETIRDWAF